MLTQTILSDVPLNRLADLAARKTAGHLTPLEKLALAALVGGDEAEASAPALIDEALATYNHGGYRVPVRVVADWGRALLILTVPRDWSDEQSKRTADLMKTFLAKMASGDPAQAITIPAGSKLEVYEVADPAQAGVRVTEGKANG
jgi:hypothetical protein